MADDSVVVKQSDIKITVSLNAEKNPVAIDWLAVDSGMDGSHAAKSFMLSIWDKPEKSTMRIDLWTTEMSVEEMQFFFYETLASMADTYERSTNDKAMALEMRDFARNFGKKTKVIA